jgi:hypothetical protein
LDVSGFKDSVNSNQSKQLTIQAAITMVKMVNGSGASRILQSQNSWRKMLVLSEFALLILIHIAGT